MVKPFAAVYVAYSHATVSWVDDGIFENLEFNQKPSIVNKQFKENIQNSNDV